MKRRIKLCSVLLAGLLMTATAGASPGLGAGEMLTFRVGWGILVGAGEIKITGSPAVAADGGPQLKVLTTTATRGFAKALYLFEARAESLFDARTGRLISSGEITKTQDKETQHSLTFDYEKGVANYTNVKEGTPPVPLKMPAGDPMDLIMSLVQARSWNLKPGDKRDALVIFSDDFYELTLHAERYEEVRTPLGTFNALLIVPRMEKTAPKGMFKRGSTVRVWISQDERRLPVKFQVDFKFGAGVATLSKYQPPTAVTTPPTNAAPAAGEKKSSEPDAKNPGP